MVRAGTYQFVLDVVDVPPDSYARALEAYIDSAIRSIKPVAIYEYGRVTNPGISDIDLIIVTGHESRGLPLHLDSFVGYFIDKPVLIPVELFSQLPRMIYAPPLKHCWGEKLDLVSATPDNRMIISAIQLIDASQILLHRMIKMSLRRRVSVRAALLRLNSIGHSVKLAAASGVTVDKRTTDFIGEVSRLRATWLDAPDYELLADLLKQAAEELASVLRGLGDAARQNGWYTPEEEEYEERVVQVTPTSFSVYSNAGAQAGHVERGLSGPSISLRRSSADLSFSVASLPLFAFRHLQACGGGNGVIPRALRRIVGVEESPAVSEAYRSTLGERMLLGSRHWELLRKNGLLRFGQFPIYGVPLESLARGGLASHLKDRLPAEIVGAAARLWYRSTHARGA